MAEVDDQLTLEELSAILDRAGAEQIAQALAIAITLAWTGQVQAALQAANQAFQAGATIEQVIEVFGTQLSRRLATRVAQDVQRSVEMLYQLGRSEVGAAGITATGRGTIQFMEDSTLFWIENHFDRHVQERIQNLGREVFEEGLGAVRAGQRFAQSELGRQFAKSRSYWELLANAVTTRTRELAHIDAFDDLGFDEVMIDAVIDVRTSCICRTLDGTRIPVSALVRFKEKMMNAESPLEIKNEISPWLSCERVRTLKSQGPEALARAGVVSPPFHGHCRSRLSAPV